MARRPGRMGNLGQTALDQTNRELADTELQILLDTTIDWEQLRPQVSDQETYDKLIDTVEQATTNNENLAQLKIRIEALGQAGLEITRKVLSVVA